MNSELRKRKAEKIKLLYSLQKPGYKVPDNRTLIRESSDMCLREDGIKRAFFGINRITGERNAWNFDVNGKEIDFIELPPFAVEFNPAFWPELKDE